MSLISSMARLSIVHRLRAGDSNPEHLLSQVWKVTTKRLSYTAVVLEEAAGCRRSSSSSAESSAGARRPTWKFLDGHHDACKCAMETLQISLHHGKDTEVCGLGSAPCWQHEIGRCLAESSIWRLPSVREHT